MPVPTAQQGPVIPGLENLPEVTGGDTLPAPGSNVSPQPPANIGGPVAADQLTQQLLQSLQGTAQNLNPVALALQAGKQVPGLFKNLTPSGPSGITGFQPDEAPVVKAAVPKTDESPDDLRGLSKETRDEALASAKALLSRGVISYDDAPRGGTLNHKLLIAYRRYLKKNK